jgi:hypothetical protein
MGLGGVKVDRIRILHAIKECKGILYQAAKMLNCERKSLYNWKNSDPEIAEAVLEARKLAEEDRENMDEEIRGLAYDSIIYHLKKKNIPVTLSALEAKTKWKKHVDLALQGNIKIESVDYKDA